VKRNYRRTVTYLTWALFFGLTISCNAVSDDWADEEGESPAPTSPPAATEAAPETTPPPTIAGGDKWALWSGSTQLRGANIWQRVVVPALDGADFLGDGHVGPPYTQDDFDRLDDLLTTVDNFAGAHGVPVAVNEFGVVRWVPGAAEFMDDQMALFEQRGMNHALWVWDPVWEPWTEEVNGFNFRYGPDPDSNSGVESDLQNVILKYWERNTVRPSNFAEKPPADQFGNRALDRYVEVVD